MPAPPRCVSPSRYPLPPPPLPVSRLLQNPSPAEPQPFGLQLSMTHAPPRRARTPRRAHTDTLRAHTQTHRAHTRTHAVQRPQRGHTTHPRYTAHTRTHTGSADAGTVQTTRARSHPLHACPLRAQKRGARNPRTLAVQTQTHLAHTNTRSVRMQRYPMHAHAHRAETPRTRAHTHTPRQHREARARTDNAV